MANDINILDAADAVVPVRTIDRGGGVGEVQIIGLDLNPAGAEQLMSGVLPTNDQRSSSAAATATWTSATADNTALTLDVSTYQSAALSMAGNGGAITAGVVEFEATVNGSDWWAINAPIEQVSWGGSAAKAWSLTDLSNNTFPIVVRFDAVGFSAIRVRLTDPIVGAGSALFYLVGTTAPASQQVVAKQDRDETYAVTLGTALPSGSNAIGKLAANNAVDIGDVTINNASGASAVNIQDGGNSITVDGTVAVSGTVAVTDNAGSLTVDAPVGTPVFARLSDGSAALVGQKAAAASLPVVLASDQGAVPISDNAGSITVDGSVAVSAVPADPFGVNADAIVAAGAVGSISAKLRRATQGLEDLKSLIVLAAGTNAIGKLAANSGVDIGDVDITSIAAGTNTIGAVNQATGTAYTGLLSFANRFTSAQTSANLVAGTASQRIYVSHLTIATGGTTAGRVSIYYGTGAFTAGTSITLFDGEFVPSATAAPGAVLAFPIPPGGASAAADNLRITTSAAITVYITLHYWKV